MYYYRYNIIECEHDLIVEDRYLLCMRMGLYTLQ